MTGIADPIVYILEDIEQVPLGHPLFKQGFPGFQALLEWAERPGV